MKQLAALVFIVLFTASPATAQDFAGTVKTLEGTAAILRDGRKLSPAVGGRIHQKDVLLTEKGTMGVLFRDGSSVSLASNSRVEVDEYLYSPEEGALGFVSKVAKGAVLYVSGRIGDLRPESFEVRTPLTTIGIRGTRFLVSVD